MRTGKVEESDIADLCLPEGPGPVDPSCRNTTGGRQDSHIEIGNDGYGKSIRPQQKNGVNGSNQKPFTPIGAGRAGPRRNECSRLRMGGPKKTFALQHA